MMKIEKKTGTDLRIDENGHYDGDVYNDEIQHRIDTYPVLPGENSYDRTQRLSRELNDEIGLTAWHERWMAKAPR